MLTLIKRNIDLSRFDQIEYSIKYDCFYILKGSRTHTCIALEYGDIFE